MPGSVTGLVLDTGGERPNWREGRDPGQEDLTVRESCDFGEPPLCFNHGRYAFRQITSVVMENVLDRDKTGGCETILEQVQWPRSGTMKTAVEDRIKATRARSVSAVHGEEESGHKDCQVFALGDEMMNIIQSRRNKQICDFKLLIKVQMGKDLTKISRRKSEGEPGDVNLELFNSRDS